MRTPEVVKGWLAPVREPHSDCVRRVVERSGGSARLEAWNPTRAAWVECSAASCGAFPCVVVDDAGLRTLRVPTDTPSGPIPQPS